MSEQDLRTNPYVGLRPFFADDSLYFYGRDEQTEELLAILRQNRLLGVVGSSGSGKSSLVRAGLVPGLLGGFLVQDRDQWRMAQVKPGEAPIGNLCAGLLAAVEGSPSDADLAGFEQDVRDGHTGAVIDFLRPRLDSNANLFLLVDQFEEIFAFRGIDEEEDTAHLDQARRKERARRKAEAIDFVDLLLTLAAQNDLPIYVALTMRTDFLGDCDLFRGLPEALNRGRYLVPRMSRSQLRDAAECPALLLGEQVAPRLLDHIINELGDRFDRLPVLQHALMRTWDEWERAGGIGPIDLRHYEAAGGLAGALARDAEAAMAGLDVQLTARVFKRLTDTDLGKRRIRSPARISELMAAADTDRQTIELILVHFQEDGRNFVNRSDDGRPDDPRVDISHESLIRQWRRLRDWVDAERNSRDNYKELVTRAGKYGQGDVPLLQDPELQLTVAWRDEAMPTEGWARRYSETDGDFARAMDYIDESLILRCRNLAERELSTRWKKISNRMLVSELLAGIWLASDFGATTVGTGEDGLIKESGRLITEFVEKSGKIWKSETQKVAEVDYIGTLGDLWEVLGLALEKSGELILSWNFFMIVIFVGLCIGMNRSVAAWYRGRRLPGILLDIESQSGMELYSVEELPDASHARDIAYATAGQRFRGWIEDVIRQSITAFLIFSLGFLVVVVLELALGIRNDPEEFSTLDIAALVAVVIVNWWRSVTPITSEHQATKGMRRAGVYRTDKYGRPLSLARASVWYLVRAVTSILYFLGFLIQPLMPRRQTFHDWVAGTVVLQVPPTVTTQPESETENN